MNKPVMIPGLSLDSSTLFIIHYQYYMETDKQVIKTSLSSQHHDHDKPVIKNSLSNHYRCTLTHYLHMSLKSCTILPVNTSVVQVVMSIG